MTYTGCRPLTEDETERILNGCQGRYRARDVALIVTGIYTGYRLQELLSIRVGQVWAGNEVAHEVRVTKGYMKGKKRGRTMPLHQKVRDALHSLIQSTQMWHPLYRDWPLFRSQNRPKSLSTRQGFDIIVNAAKTAGLDTNRLGSHSLRKTFAARLWKSELIHRDMSLMAHALGHSNFSNTLRYLEFANELEAAILA